jgi:hypothetical protein
LILIEFFAAVRDDTGAQKGRTKRVTRLVGGRPIRLDRLTLPSRRKNARLIKRAIPVLEQLFRGAELTHHRNGLYFVLALGLALGA